jgi:hypothetical protein
MNTITAPRSDKHSINWSQAVEERRRFSGERGEEKVVEGGRALIEGTVAASKRRRVRRKCWFCCRQQESGRLLGDGDGKAFKNITIKIEFLLLSFFIIFAAAVAIPAVATLVDPPLLPILLLLIDILLIIAV